MAYSLLFQGFSGLGGTEKSLAFCPKNGGLEGEGYVSGDFQTGFSCNLALRGGWKGAEEGLERGRGGAGPKPRRKSNEKVTKAEEWFSLHILLFFMTLNMGGFGPLGPFAPHRDFSYLFCFGFKSFLGQFRSAEVAFLVRQNAWACEGFWKPFPLQQAGRGWHHRELQ